MSHPAPIRRVAAVAALVAGLLVVAGLTPVLAKAFLEARLDAPIALDSPPGAILVVGATVETLTDDGGMGPVEGGPVYLRLTGRDGSTTRAAGAADPLAGHYTFTIEVPLGGARAAEIEVSGTPGLPMHWTEIPLTIGPITAGTAQLAPSQAGTGDAAPAVPAPQPAAPQPDPAAPDPAAAAPAVPAVPSVEAWAAAPPVGAWLALGAGVLAVVLALGALVRIRRSRADLGRVADGVPGA